MDERRTLHVELLSGGSGEPERLVWKVVTPNFETESGLDVIQNFDFPG